MPDILEENKNKKVPEEEYNKAMEAYKIIMANSPNMQGGSLQAYLVNLSNLLIFINAENLYKLYTLLNGMKPAKPTR